MPESLLDNAATYDRLDPHGLYGRIWSLPEQIDEAWSAATTLPLPDALSRRRARRRARHGRLGDRRQPAAGARRQYRRSDPVLGRARLHDCRRTSTAAHSCWRRRTVATPRRLSRRSPPPSTPARAASPSRRAAASANWRREHGLPWLRFAWDGEPRSALGWSSASLIAICGRLGLIDDQSDALAGALGELRALTRDARPGRAGGGEPGEGARPAPGRQAAGLRRRRGTRARSPTAGAPR